MPTRKIGDLPRPSDGWFAKPEEPCFHPEHDPPKHVCLPPGIYEHECPGCGRKKVFTVQGYRWSATPVPRRGSVWSRVG